MSLCFVTADVTRIIFSRTTVSENVCTLNYLSWSRELRAAHFYLENEEFRAE